MSQDLDPQKWVDEYGDYLFRRALLLVSKPEIAEDLVQDTLLSAYQSVDNFRGQSSVRTWLTTILKNKVIDHMRKAVRREIPTAFEDPYDGDDPDFTSWGIWKNAVDSWSSSDQQSAEERLQDEGFANAILSCIAKLPGAQRNVLRLRVFEDMSLEDICKELEISPSNAGVLLFRSRLALRTCLDKNWYNKV